MVIFQVEIPTSFEPSKELAIWENWLCNQFKEKTFVTDFLQVRDASILKSDIKKLAGVKCVKYSILLRPCNFQNNLCVLKHILLMVFFISLTKWVWKLCNSNVTVNRKNSDTYYSWWKWSILPFNLIYCVITEWMTFAYSVYILCNNWLNDIHFTNEMSVFQQCGDITVSTIMPDSSWNIDNTTSLKHKRKSLLSHSSHQFFLKFNGICNYASPSSGDSYSNRQLTANFELWVEIFLVADMFPYEDSKTLSVCTPRKEIILASSISVLH